MKRLFQNLSLKTKSVLKKVTVATLCSITVGVGVFYACKKDDIATQDNIKVQKFDPNDFADMIVQPYFKDFEAACIDFLGVLPIFTQAEIDRMNELLELIQWAIDLGDYDVIQKYIDEYLRIFYQTDEPNLGREKFENFSTATVVFINEMTENYPVFEELNEAQQVEILTAVFSNMDFPMPNFDTAIILPPDMLPSGYDACVQSANNERYAWLAASTAVYIAGLAGCIGSGGWCIPLAMAGYGLAIASAEHHYETELALCRAKWL